MVPLYPPLAKNKGLSDELIGYIFCIYPVGSFLVTLILGKSMTNQNKKRAMEIGLLLSILGMIGFSLIENVINKAYFITYSAILRLITGIVKKLKLLQNPKKWYIFFYIEILN